MTAIEPYWADEDVTLYLGKCEDVLPSLPADSASIVLTDPPYGIGKAEWDAEFQSGWMADAARIAPALGLMPGTWNLLKCPETIGRLRYRWTLAAHIVNGMTRGALGYGNWIPCLVYGANNAAEWCSAFADWCTERGISRADLDACAGTSDMGGWWMSRLPHRSQVPTSVQWAKLRLRFGTPPEFDTGVMLAERLYRQASDAQRIIVGREDKPNHPSPKPISVMRWLVDRLTFAGDLIIDPFAGSGTTLVAARELGRPAIGIEVEERYCEVIARRLSQGVLGGITPAAEVTSLPEPAQPAMFDLGEAS